MTKGENVCNKTWFVEHEFPFIAKYFSNLESNLLKKRCSMNSTTSQIESKNYLDAILGIEGVRFEDYTLSGQCIIANFGFVQEQGWHTDYKPVTYD